MTPFFAHLSLPQNVDTLLFDMDGVLLDSLGLDIQIAGPLFTRYVGRPVAMEPAFIKSIFAYDPKKFLELIFDRVELEGPVPNRDEIFPKMHEEYLQLRRTTPFPLLPGVKELLEHTAAKNFKRACVSNNPVVEVRNILKTSGIIGYFTEVVGNDMSDGDKPLRKKPAPDTYLFAASKFGSKPENCAVFEDSALGCMAGLAAGMHVVGLLTGSADKGDLQKLSPSPQQIFKNFTEQAA
jgi:beta-phosphoglucomutase-like phosphatase (HAD superfamily)